MWFNEYPYLNISDLNLDFILKAIKDLKYEVTNFVSLNAIKYADPIEWRITSQYEKNTVVIDAQTGTAYLSVAPVPAGVALNRTEFWTPIFNLSRFIETIAQNFANRYEESDTTTATFSTPANYWLVWGGVLYKAKVNITAGDAYVINSNIEPFTIEDLIGHLSDLITDDKDNIVAAINWEVGKRRDADGVLQQNIDTETLNRQNADGTLQQAIDTETLNRQNADGVLQTAINNREAKLKCKTHFVHS